MRLKKHLCIRENFSASVFITRKPPAGSTLVCESVFLSCQFPRARSFREKIDVRENSISVAAGMPGTSHAQLYIEASRKGCEHYRDLRCYYIKLKIQGGARASSGRRERLTCSISLNNVWTLKMYYTCHEVHTRGNFPFDCSWSQFFFTSIRAEFLSSVSKIQLQDTKAIPLVARVQMITCVNKREQFHFQSEF